MELSTREIAAAIWVALLIGLGSSNQKIRRTFVNVLEAAWNWKILVPVCVLAAYTAGISSVLIHVKLWDWDLLKETLLWFCFSAVALPFKAIINDEEQSLWRSTLLNQIKIGSVLTYLVNTYVFPLWAELILLPTLSFIVMVNVIAKNDEQHAIVARITTDILIAYGLVVLGLAIHNAISSYGPAEFDLMARSLLLIPLLAMSLKPLLFLFQVLSSYEQLWLRLRLGPDKNPSVVKYAKWQLLRHLRLRPRRIRAFLRQHALDLMRVKTREDVDHMLMRAAYNRDCLSR